MRKLYQVAWKIKYGPAEGQSGRNSGFGRVQASQEVARLRNKGMEAYVVGCGEKAPWEREQAN